MVALTRLFFAVGVTTEARHVLAAQLEGVEIPGRRVSPPNWHITLRFVGAVDDSSQDQLIRSVDRADLGTGFRVRWGALGAFPRTVKATVLWLGLTEGVDRLTDLAGWVESAVVSTGIPAEDRPFRPHLSLSRIRPPVDVTDLVASVDPTRVVMPVQRVLLMASHLGDGGTRYERVESFELG